MRFLAALVVGFLGFVLVARPAEGSPQITKVITITLTIRGRAATSTVLSSVAAVSSGAATPSCAPYWLELIKHQGVAAFNSDPSYKVFRNVKDFGAVGRCLLFECFFGGFAVDMPCRRWYHRRYRSHQPRHQQRRPVRARLRILIHHSSNCLLSWWHLRNLLVNHRLLLHPTHRKSQLPPGP